MTRHLEIAFIAASLLAVVLAVYFHRSPLLAIFVVSFVADLHAAGMIHFRARKILDSWEWRVMFLAMGVSLMLTMTAVTLILLPRLSSRTFVLGWFTLFALKRVLFSIGFRRHVNNITEEFRLTDAIEPGAKPAYTVLELAAKVKGALPMTEKEEDDRNDKDQEEQPESEKPTAQPAGDPAPPPPGEVPGPGK
jgi:hypothetical protein